MRQQITAVTNKVEAYHGFSKWFFFGGEGVIANNDPEEQEKIIKYNDLIANAVVFHNAVDLTSVLRQLKREGYLVVRNDVAALSPYLTSHIKRFGDYLIDLDAVPQALDEEMVLTFRSSNSASVRDFVTKLCVVSYFARSATIPVIIN